MLANLLAAVIALLFTLIGIVAVLAIADSLRKARNAYARLMREAALMQARFAVIEGTAEMPVQYAALQQLPVQRAPSQPMPRRRTSGLRIHPLLARPIPAYAV